MRKQVITYKAWSDGVPRFVELDHAQPHYTCNLVYWIMDAHLEKYKFHLPACQFDVISSTVM
jgi:hypothetical protein